MYIQEMKKIGKYLNQGTLTLQFVEKQEIINLYLDSRKKDIAKDKFKTNYFKSINYPTYYVSKTH